RSDFHSDASSDSSSRHSLSSHSSPDLPSTFAGPSRKRRRSPMTLLPTLSPISESLSPIRADLIPSLKRGSDEPHLEHDIDPEVRAENDECTRGPVEVRVERVTHPVMPEDTLEPSQEERVVECTYETLEEESDEASEWKSDDASDEESEEESRAESFREK
nr:hypothetical protein [Tanacetum cinerariifolium]